MDSQDMPVPPQPPHRTNTDLNLGVLRRYLPSIRSIISIAANAVVYSFSPGSQSWDKTGIEGTLFVCEQEPLFVAGKPLLRACVFVLNRRGLDNLVVELANASVCEASGELIMFNVEKPRNAEAAQGNDNGTGDTQIIGVWIHADQDDTRDVNMAVIQEAWRRVRLVEQDIGVESAASVERQQQQQAAPTTGRRVSITELFGQENGTVA